MVRHPNNLARSRRTRNLYKWAGSAGCVLVVVLAINDFQIKRDAQIAIGLAEISRFLIPLLVILTPTAYLWHRDRPSPRGYCHVCGYNLKGNVSRICPECGIPVLPIKDQPDLPYRSPNHCRKCDCDLTDRFTGRCPDCGARTPRFPPDHCLGCGRSFVVADETGLVHSLVGKGCWCLMCRRWHEHPYPLGHCQSCGFKLLNSSPDRCLECGTSTKNAP